jgi:GT2 family glycosyltransferase
MDNPNPLLTIHFIIHDDFTQIYPALTSLYATTHTPFVLHITINRGTPAEIARLQAAYPQAHLQVNTMLRSFAENHNAALQRAATPYVALLNDDIRLGENALDQLVTYLDQQPQAGLVAPHILNPDGTSQLSIFSDMTLLRSLYTISGLGVLTQHGGMVRRLVQRSGLARWLGTASLQPLQQTRAVPVVVGVAMLVRRSAYLQVGGMDEVTRMYGEEYGWHWRLRQAGWQVVFVAAAHVTHYNPTTDLTGWKLAEHRKAILGYFLRYRPRWQYTVIRGAIILTHSTYAALYALFQPAKRRAHWATVKMAWQLRV